MAANRSGRRTAEARTGGVRTSRRGAAPDRAAYAGLPILRIAALIAVIGAVLVLAALAARVLPAGEPSSADKGSVAAQVSSEPTTGQDEVATSPSEQTPVAASGEAIDRAALEALLEEDLVETIVERAADDPDVRWCAAHPGEFAFDGDAVQYKILKLLADEPAAAPYVRLFPVLYPAEDQDLSIDAAIRSRVTGPNKIPLLMQWDPRWAFTVYSSTSFGLTGCCPTALAMVYQGLTGKTDMTPYDMGLLAQRDGYMSEFEGTDASFLVNEAPSLGLSCTTIGVSAQSIVSALEEGYVIVDNVVPGIFTTYGHFFVLTGMQDGKVIVNDPYSLVRSEQLWDADTIASQSGALYCYKKA